MMNAQREQHRASQISKHLLQNRTFEKSLPKDDTNPKQRPIENFVHITKTLHNDPFGNQGNLLANQNDEVEERNLTNHLYPIDTNIDAKTPPKNPYANQEEYNTEEKEIIQLCNLPIDTNFKRRRFSFQCQDNQSENHPEENKEEEKFQEERKKTLEQSQKDEDDDNHQNVISNQKHYKNYSLALKTLTVETKNRYRTKYASIKFGIPESTVKNWVSLSNQGRILEDQRIYNARPFDKQLDDELISYFKELRTLGIHVDGLMIKARAKDLRPDSSFKASKGWLCRFFNRNKIVRRKPTHIIQKPTHRL